MAINTETQEITIHDNAAKLRQGWRKVRFDQIAESITDRVDNPAEANVEYYVGLEHLDSESLKISRWGSPNDVEATKLRFKPGDIIFGKRRAYQRKVAIAEFEGICSAHALVLRAREETVLKEFLPFFMQSEIFFERALSISVGSLSPTINWTALARQEFVIPPKDEQRRIADILWAVESAISSVEIVLEELQEVKKHLLRKLFADYYLLTPNGISSLGNIGTWQTGSTPSKQILRFWQEGDVAWITPKDVKSDIIEDTEDHITVEAISDTRAKIFPKGSILLVWRSGILKHTLPIAKLALPSTVNQDIKVLMPNSNILSEYVRYFLQTFDEEIRIKCVKKGTTVESLDTELFLLYPIPTPPFQLQKELVEIANKLEDALKTSFIKRQASLNMRSRLLFTLLSKKE